MSTTRLPVLFLTDLVVLPGMVVPIELDDAARAAVDAARSHSDGRAARRPPPGGPLRLVRRRGHHRPDRPAGRPASRPP